MFHCRRISTATARRTSSCIAHLTADGLSDTPPSAIALTILATTNGVFLETPLSDS